MALPKRAWIRAMDGGNQEVPYNRILIHFQP